MNNSKRGEAAIGSSVRTDLVTQGRFWVRVSSKPKDKVAQRMAQWSRKAAAPELSDQRETWFVVKVDGVLVVGVAKRGTRHEVHDPYATLTNVSSFHERHAGEDAVLRS